MKLPHLIALTAAAALFAASPSPSPAADVTLKDEGGKVRVEIGGQHFTDYLYEGHAKPVLYPVYGPGGEPMTRNHPFIKGVEGEAADHPHHESLWYTHGMVNGVDFWALGEKCGKIVQTAMKLEGNAIVAENKWTAPGGETVLTDERRVSFGAADNGGRYIDFEIKLKATEGDVVFGDTKEGSMGIRTNPALRLKPAKDGGPSGHATNSAGDKDKDLWGKNAAWVDYWGKIGDSEVGVAIFDHPKNPRYPTTWHARDYGLVAANPFGINDFQKKGKGAGDLKIAKGESVTFRYRFLFHPGDAEKGDIANQWKAWAEK